MNIVVLGSKRAGKSSILKKIFHKISNYETLFLESTIGIQEFQVSYNNFNKCCFYDFPGNFEITQMNSAELKQLESAQILIYVIDAKDEPYNKNIEKFLTVQSEVFEMNPYCVFELLVHKVDGEMFSNEESKKSLLSEISELIKLNSQERSLQAAEIFLTSIMDHSIYVSISRILQKLNPFLLSSQAALDLFISVSMIEKAYIIDIVTKLFVSTDSRPIDNLSYELCCDAIDISIELSTIYGLTSPEQYEQAFDSNSLSTITCDNGYNITFNYFDHLLAVVCIVKDSSFSRKEIIELNLQVLKKTFAKILKACDKVFYSGDEKKKT